MTKPKPRYVTAQGAADYLAISKRAFYLNVRPNLAGVKVGRQTNFDRRDIDAWVARQKRPVKIDPTVRENLLKELRQLNEQDMARYRPARRAAP